ncbi:hypothetical protein AA313_de0207840 [Arthrobotrys entomopaga]|nr:hypothetical protein AA313_de0207840 [Arthrobotrys entomopaga]
MVFLVLSSTFEKITEGIGIFVCCRMNSMAAASAGEVSQEHLTTFDASADL